MRRRSLAFLLLFGLSACGAAASSTPATSTPSTSVGVASTVVTTTTVALAPVPIAMLDEPLVRFQAEWFCQSSQTAYASTADIDSALGVRLASAGIDRTAYDAFVGSLGVDNLTRAAVLQVFLQTCH